MIRLPGLSSTSHTPTDAITRQPRFVDCAMTANPSVASSRNPVGAGNSVVPVGHTGLQSLAAVSSAYREPFNAVVTPG